MTSPIVTPPPVSPPTETTGIEEEAPRPSPTPAARRNLRPAALVVAIHVAAALLFVHRIIPHLGTQTAGVPGDSDQFVWGLAYTPWALLHGHSPLFTDRVLAPGGVNLMWNTTTPLLGFVATPLSLAFGPVVTYNVVLTAVIVANGLSCYLCLRRFVPDRVARTGASLFWSYSGYAIAHSQAGHLNLEFIALIPPLLLLLHELAVRQSWSPRKTGVLLGLLLGAQLLVSNDLFLSEVVAAIVGLLLVAVLGWRQVRSRLPYLVRGSCLAGLVFILIAAYPLWMQFLGPQRITGGIFRYPGVFVGDLRMLVVPTFGLLKASAYGYGPSHFTGDAAEFNSYLGVPLLLVAAGTVVLFYRRRLVLWAGLFALTMTLLSFGQQLHINGVAQGPPLPWALIQNVPVLDNLTPGRLAVFADLAVALLLAVAIQAVRQQRSLVVRLCGLAVALEVAVTLLPISLPPASAETPAFFTSSALTRFVPANSTVLVLPLDPGGLGTVDDFSALVWQAQARMRYRMVDGYWNIPSSDPLHRGENQIGPSTTQFMQALLNVEENHPGPLATSGQVKAALRAGGVQRILLGPMPRRAQVLAFLTTTLGPPDVSDGGVYVWLPSHWVTTAGAPQAGSTQAAQ